MESLNLLLFTPIDLWLYFTVNFNVSPAILRIGAMTVFVNPVCTLEYDDGFIVGTNAFCQLIRGGKLVYVISPVYLLMGEEEFYIDHLTNLILQNAISEQEKDFNLSIIYGKDTTINQIISTSKQYPTMAERKLIIVKEAQDLLKKILTEII